jgi:hypothetical protein
MAEPHTHAAGLRAQCGFGAFCKPGNFLDRGPRLRMRAQFFLFGFGVFTANALLVPRSHNMLLDLGRRPSNIVLQFVHYQISKL